MLAFKNIYSLFKTISSIQFKNTIWDENWTCERKTQSLKIGEYHLGISSDIRQFWLRHVTCLDQSRASSSSNLFNHISRMSSRLV